MENVIKRELLDFLDLNEILFEDKVSSIVILHPKYGKCTYWFKKDKLHVHAENEWKDNGYYFIKNGK